jgi:hypothetical protein
MDFGGMSIFSLFFWSLYFFPARLRHAGGGYFLYQDKK